MTGSCAACHSVVPTCPGGTLGDPAWAVLKWAPAPSSAFAARQLRASARQSGAVSSGLERKFGRLPPDRRQAVRSRMNARNPCDGAAPESNRPSVGLPHRTGFEVSGRETLDARRTLGLHAPEVASPHALPQFESGPEAARILVGSGVVVAASASAWSRATRTRVSSTRSRRRYRERRGNAAGRTRCCYLAMTWFRSSNVIAGIGAPSGKAGLT